MKESRSKSVLSLLNLITFVGLIILSFENVYAASSVTLKLGHAGSKGTPQDVGSVRFSELVDKYTDGRVKVQVFPDSMLGGSKALVEGVMLGTVEVAVTTVLDAMEPKAAIPVLPYLFRDADHAEKVLNSPIGEEIYTPFLSKGIRVLCVWDGGGFRQTLSKRPINKLEDLRGLKIRVPQTDLYISVFKALGANPTPMTFSEVYSGLQQGVVDGMEQPLSQIYDMKFYEVAKNIALTSHIYCPFPVVTSEKVYKSLPVADQDAVLRAAKDTIKYVRNAIDSELSTKIAKMKESGVRFSNPDVVPFRTASVVVYSKYEKDFGKELIQRIRDYK